MQYRLPYFIYLTFLILILLEVVLIRRSCKSAFSWQESLSSLIIAVGHHITKTFFSVISLAAFSIAWQHRLLTIPLDRAWGILLLFLGIEWCYYWYHRASHEIRWMWATHAVHHSVQQFNLSAAYRLGWTGVLSGNFLFFLPLCWVGFHPVAVSAGLSLNLAYQFWIHTELISRLGWLEKVLNTPSHHRVHHASNPGYIDRNYGGVVIIFDRIFGTFTAEKPTQPPIYGLTHPLRSHNPLVIPFHEWGRLCRDLLTTKSWQKRCWMILGRPS